MIELTDDDRKAMALPDVQCANCTAGMRPEHALMHDGMPFCDEFCHGMWARQLHGPSEARDSIEVARNAKGEYSWKIKMYYSNTDDASTETREAINRIDKKLRGDYLEVD